MRVKWSDLERAFEFASFGRVGECNAYLCKQTGRLYWHSESLDEEEAMPDDIDDEDKYLPIPHKNELGLGKPLVLDFTRQFLPNDFDEVWAMFSRKGGYAKFNALLTRRRAIDKWHAFENKMSDRVLRQWCKANSVVIGEEP